MQVIKVKGLVKQYGNLTAVDKLNLEIEKGELFAQLGVNGAGKSTLYQSLPSLQEMERVNTDELVRAFGNWRNSSDVLRAGKIAIRKIHQYISGGVTFNQETTLCGRSILKYIELAKGRVSQDVLKRFDCGHPDFNDFLAADAKECAESGNGVTYIGDGAFIYCSSLKNIEIPDSVADIGYGAFANCPSLENAAIGNGIASIGEYAFSTCPKLESLTIENPECEITDSETTIDPNAVIYGCWKSTAHNYAIKYNRKFAPLDDIYPSDKMSLNKFLPKIFISGSPLILNPA